MSLEEKLKKISQQIRSGSPLASQVVENFIRTLSDSNIVQYVLKAGDKIPDFCLENIHGEMVSIQDILENESAVITFYRGGWCPYCSVEMQAWQDVYEQIKKKSYELIAISPEKAEFSSTRGSTMNLDFVVLSDPGNNVARLFGLVFKLSIEMKDFLDNFGVDLVTLNGYTSPELPIPATYVVNQDRIIEYAFFDVDYRIRKDPEEILKLL